MHQLNRNILLFTIILIFIFPLNIYFSFNLKSEYYDEIKLEPLECIDNNKESRFLSLARGNFRIYSNSLIISPQINGSWNQSDWSGGPGQFLLNEPTKFNYSSNLEYSTPNGHVEFEEMHDIEVWKQLGDGKGPRIKHTFTYISGKQVFYMFGGKASGSSTISNTLYEFNPATDDWNWIGQEDPPPERESHAAAWDSINNLFWVYGGSRSNPDTLLNDLWNYNPSTNLWTQKSDGPNKREDHTLVFYPNAQQLILYGGKNQSISNPLKDVHVYDIVNDTWIQKKNFTNRVYHDAIWCEKTKSMFVYGGASGYISDYIFVNDLHEYFPNNDTWINRSAGVDRLRPVMAWDVNNEKIIMHGGGLGGASYRNDTWYYDIDSDSWTKKMYGPPPRDFNDGDWDLINNQLIIYGGLENIPGKETWAYLPNTTGYSTSGSLISSVYNPGYKMKMTSISYNLSKPLDPKIGPNPITIQLAGSGVSADDTNIFLGPDGTTNTYFTEESGQFIPDFLDGSKYFVYKVDFRSWSNLYTPELNWIRIDYYNYPSSYIYESSIFDTDFESGFPLRYVNWTSIEPAGTGIDIYFRQSSDDIDIKSKLWEKVTKGQELFSYDHGRYFQYKAVLNTTERDKKPTLETIDFLFNALPLKPMVISPTNNTWIGDSKPIIKWEFDDPDPSDYQTAFKIKIGEEETLSHLTYDSYKVESANKSFTIKKDLKDGIYYWSISVCDNYGSWSDWSEILILKIDTEKPAAPVIHSNSHPYENIWYNNNDISLDWVEPTDESGINGYSFILDRLQYNEPSENITMTDEEFRLIINQSGSSGLFDQNDVSDGLWYFHIKAVDMVEHWSHTSTKIVRIDTQPPLLNDRTTNNVSMDSDLIFTFDLNDTNSGVDTAMLYWKYSYEMDFGYSELVVDNNGYYTHKIKVKNTYGQTIEYYLKITDLSEKSNEIRYPNSGQYKINIIDDISPKIVEATGDIVHNPVFDLIINVEATDNVGVSEANVFIKNQQGSMKMTKNPDGSFSLQVERGELTELASGDGEDLIFYYIVVEDNSGNTARTPETGYNNISLKKVEGADGTPAKTADDKQFSKIMMTNILIIVILIVIVAIIIFIFIKKQSRKISEDRHKLRMAIADTQEAAAGKGAPQHEIQPITEITSSLSLQEPISFQESPQESEVQQVPEHNVIAPEHKKQQFTQDIQTQPLDYTPEVTELSTEDIENHERSKELK